jgi:probable F420-dependent oxidoreductase
MRLGFGLPTAGPSANGPDIVRVAQRVEALGFESVWCGDHLVMPAGQITQYPYTADGSFARPPTTGFLEPFTLLAYVAGATRTVKLGMTVIVLPYRNPIVQAKMLACLDVLSGGRLICGVGVGWLEKEFEVLRAPYRDRGPVSDEYLEIFKSLWTQDEPRFHGRFCAFDGIVFAPKPLQKPHPPIWVGGHSRSAIQQLTFDFRTGRVDDMLAIIEHVAAAVVPAIQG